MKKITVALLGATALTAASVNPAEAAPVAAAIIGFIAPTLAGTALTLATGALTLGLYVAASVGMSLLQRALSGGRNNNQVGGTSGKLQAGGIVPRTIPFGRYPASHSLIYANSYGRVGKSPNTYLVQVFQLSDMPIGGLAELHVNGTRCTLSGSTTNAPGTTQGGFRTVTEYFKPTDNGRASADHLWVKFVDGTQTTADPFLVSQFGSDPDYPYQSTRIGLGCAYAIVIARYNPEVLSGFPQFKFVVDGARFYDLRLDSTAGGSGPHRWNDPSTWGPSDNPIVIAYNIMRGIQYGGKWLYGGQTIIAGQLPASSWIAAMNVCDEPVTLVGGGTEKRYRASGEINTSRLATETIQDLLATCAGRIAQVGGIYKVSVGAPGIAVMSITDDDILSTEPETFEPFKAIQDRANAVTAKYLDPVTWEPKDAPPLISETYIAEDGKVSLAPLSIDYAPYPVQVQRLMKSALDENRRERTHQLPMPSDAWALEPLDVVSWSSTRNGYLNKLFRVDQVSDGARHVVGLSLTEVDPASYAWTPNLDQRTVVAPPIVSSTPSAQPILDWSASPHTLNGADGRQRAAILLAWDGDVEDVSGVQYEVWDATGTQIVFASETDRYDVGSIIITANLIPATAYRVRGRYRPSSPRQTMWSGYINVTTPDVRIGINELHDLVAQPLASAKRDADWIAARVADLEAGIREVALMAANIDAAVGVVAQENRETMQVQAGEFTGRIENTRTIATTANGIAVSARDEIEAARQGALSLSARITANNTARIDGDTALAGSINTITAQINDPSTGLAKTRADLATADAARVSGDAALAGRITTAETVLGGSTGLASFSLGAQSLAGGSQAAINFQVKAVNGAVQQAGLRLFADQNGGRVDVQAGQFRVLDDNGNPITVFNSNGAFVGNLAANVVTAGNIVSGQLTAHRYITFDSTFTPGTVPANGASSWVEFAASSAITLTSNSGAIGGGSNDTPVMCSFSGEHKTPSATSVVFSGSPSLLFHTQILLRPSSGADVVISSRPINLLLRTFANATTGAITSTEFNTLMIGAYSIADGLPVAPGTYTPILRFRITSTAPSAWTPQAFSFTFRLMVAGFFR